MSAETRDSPEPEDARDEAAAPVDAEAAEPDAAAAQDAPEEAVAEAGGAGDAQAGAGAEPEGDAKAAAEGQPEAKKRRRAPRVRKGASGKQDAPAKEPGAAPARSRARRGKAAAPKAEADAPAAAPSPRRTKPSSRPRRRVVRARARYVRTSARKARLVCVHLRGKSVAQARAILAFAPRAVARDWSKLLESAVANAENNHELLEEDLIIREAYADEGPTIKRFRPRAMGRATPIRKRTSHLTITLQASSSQDHNKRAG
jgi:ribosomal protein L22